MGVKTFSRSEEFFLDHFPGMPIVPGVLQIEVMAQIAGKCIAMAQPTVLPVLGSVKSAKFYQSIGPGDRMIAKAQIIKLGKNFAVAETVIEVDDRKISSATILFGYAERGMLKEDGTEFDSVTKEFKARKKAEAEKKAAETT